MPAPTFSDARKRATPAPKPYAHCDDDSPTSSYRALLNDAHIGITTTPFGKQPD
ncbi:hypothetical protein ACWCQS_45970 [Streptomyces sp. NPDC002076]